jgi:hypothetical protein
MARLVKFGRKSGTLTDRRQLEVELPEWLIRIIEYRVVEANEGDADEPVRINDVVEWCLVAPITLKDVPAYEAAIPGVTAALSKWLEEATYDPEV